MERKLFIRDSLLHFFLLIVCVVADQLTKLWARTELSGAPIIVWKKVFSFRLVYNTGGAWGVLNKHTWVLTVFSIAVMIAIVVAYFLVPKTKKMRLMRFSMMLIIAGAIGNIIDRVGFGKVTDMFSFDLINFPVFNVADICVVCGCILMCVLLIFYYKDEDFGKWKKSNS